MLPSDGIQADSPEIALWSRFRDAVFGIFFCLIKEGSIHPIFVAVSIVIDSLQDLTFPVSFPLFPWQSEISWLRTFLSLFAPEQGLAGTTAILYIVLGLLGLVLILSLWVGYCFAQNRFRFIWTLKLLRFLLGLIVTILYIPIVSLLTTYLVTCGDAADSPIALCWAGSNLYRIYIAVVLVLFVLTTIAISFVFFEPDPHPADPLAQPHGRCDALYLCGRTILAVSSIVLRENEGIPTSDAIAQWIMGGACLIISGTMAFVWCWASLCTCYDLLRPGSDIGIIFLVLSPVAVWLHYGATKARRLQLSKLPITECKDAFTIELKIRIFLDERGLLYHHSDGRLVMARVAASPGDLGAARAAANAPVVGTPPEIETALADAETMYHEASKRLPQSCMLQLFIGQYHLIHLGNRIQCLACHGKAETLAPRLDAAFLIFRRRRMLHERFAGGDVIDFIAFEQSLRLARKSEKRAVICQIGFWGELLKQDPSLKRIRERAADISDAISAAQNHFSSILKTNGETPYVLRAYGSFLINVLNDSAGQDLLDRAEELEDAQKDDTASEQSGDTEAEDKVKEDAGVDLFSPDNAVIGISGDASNLGIIMHANPMALKVFGYKKSELIGKNINVIVPSPFSESHDMFLTRYLDTGYAKVIDRSRKVLGLDRSGYLKPMALCVKQEVAGTTNMFIGVIRSVPEKAGHEFIILDDQLNLKHMTIGFAFKYGLKTRELADLPNKSISQWIPEFTVERVLEFTTRAGFRTTHVFDAEVKQVQVTADPVSVGALMCYICRVKISEMPEVSGPQLGLPHSSMPQSRAPSVTRAASTGNNTGLHACPFAGGPGTRQPSVVPSMLPHHVFAPVHAGASGSMSSMSNDGEMPMSFSAGVSLDDVNSNPSGGAANPNTTNFSLRDPEASTKFVTMDKANVPRRKSSVGSTTRKRNRGRGIGSLQSMRATDTLTRLHYVVIGMLIVLVVLAITSEIRFKQNLDTYGAGLIRIRDVGDVCLQAISTFYATRTIDLTYAGILTASNVSAAKTQMNTSLTYLQSTKSIFAASSTSSLPPANVLLQASLTDTTTSYSTLFDAIGLLVTKGSYVISSTSASDPLLPSLLSFVMLNTPNTILAALNATASLSQASVTASIGSLRTEAICWGVLGPCFALIITLVVFIIGRRIETDRTRLLRLYLEIPREVVRGIYEGAVARRDEAKNDDEDDDDEAPRIHLSTFGLNTSSGETRKSKSELRPQSWINKLQNQYALASRSSTIFMATVLYFVAICTAVGITVDSTLGVDLFWRSLSRSTLVRLINYQLRESWALTNTISTPPSAIRPSATASTQVASLISSLSWIENGLIYSDSNMGTPGLSTQNSDLSTLELVSGCISGVSPSDCSTFSSSIMSQGLHPAILSYMDNARVASLSLSNSSQYSVNATASTFQQVSLVYSLDQLYLPTALDYSSTIELNQAATAVARFSNLNIGLTVAYCVFLCCFYLLLFVPLLRKIGEDLRRNNDMLFMIPDSVLARMVDEKRGNIQSDASKLSLSKQMLSQSRIFRSAVVGDGGSPV
ncbi:hypothetical protein SmJEL517_g02736 [Synchytrium microbalum]|uniref:PAS domain-containing protein n=1 Tax=Synchytrium microbalum TaxID=1806994 RepID=A0A507CB17_9FUNG|nr:uncharacterized protein SmJEL517_g02736 [Synchytrium microbalum]TPX34725.1 hypothetical protein SmJEL517_g02736 [Synchytrium microbalum]